MDNKNDESESLTATNLQTAVSIYQQQQRSQQNSHSNTSIIILFILILLVLFISYAFKAHHTKQYMRPQESKTTISTKQLQNNPIQISISQSANLSKKSYFNSSFNGQNLNLTNGKDGKSVTKQRRESKIKKELINVWNRSGQANINLWQIVRQQKIRLLGQVKPQQNKSLPYTPFLNNKDQQVSQFFAHYQSRSQLINWNDKTLNQSTVNQLTQSIAAKSEELNRKFDYEIDKLKAKYEKSKGYMGQYNKGITYEQFFTTLRLKKILMTQAYSSSSPEIQSLVEQQRDTYQQKYQISSYDELPICIVMPTYNNRKDLKYIWSIESILQQQYNNLKVIIIDDNSKDSTAQHIANYLKWRKADPEKYLLIGGKQHRGALQNIYYGVHKYCDYNQIFFIIDGDDELFGRQVFKVFNAIYQKEKHYALYTQFISYDPKSRKAILDIGLSEDFPTFVKKRNSYRTFKHSYSQLRSVLSDLILLQRVSSLKLKNGSFFGLLYDNALFYPAFEMSCEKVSYVPQIFYWYNMNTGSNDWRQAKTSFYRQNRYGIELQKPYRCIDQELRKVIHSNNQS